MMKKLRILCALIFLSLHAHLMPIVSYRLIQGPQGKLILILGDVHQDNSAISVIIGALKKVQLKKPLPIVVELNEVLPYEHLVIPAGTVRALLALQKSFGKEAYAPISLSRCEPRGDMSDILQLFRKEILALCRQLITDDQFIVHTRNLYQDEKIVRPALSNSKKKEWNRKKGDVLKDSFTGRGFGFTVRSYTEYLDKNLAFLQQCRDTQKKLNWYTWFDSLVKIYVETCEEIKKNLAQGDDKQPLVKRFAAEVRACETPEALLSWAEDWSNLYLKRADYLVLDAAMGARIADSLTDDRPLCLVIGEAHASMLAQNLEPLGFKLLEEACTYHHLSMFAQNYYEEGSPEAKAFEAKLEQMMLKVLEPLMIQVKHCAVCRKTGQLKACARCKDVLYCGTECQATGWKEHQKVCQHVKVTIKQ